ncbi:T9SS type A sorting domain-containing protein [Flavobacterium antarcticum]|uniref:T9SS type A sorting domain-containing protein n=1 Tax=Flavobacterium antarcticum TaxID=271155 RepID=UPI0003B43840|nr:T9SS type A sorting domain-containing protein [Flavobacterium antarcticum]
MKRITLLFLFLFTQVLFAQFSASDVKYFIGEGTETAYLVVDFKDGTADRSYAWGIRFNPTDEISGGEMLQMVADAEPAFNFELGGGFLDLISFNSHLEESGDDWWSLWTSSFGPGEFDPAGWMSSDLENGQWYGASYGFGNPSTQAPVNPIAAYSSQWFTNANVTSWQGTGVNKSVVVVDFGTDTNGVANSFAVGLQYDGTLSGEAILTAVQSYISTFSFSMSNSEISAITFGANTETGTWNIFQGTNLSDWANKTTLSQVTLSNNQWLGLSYGTRRPFKPQEMTTYLGSNNNSKSALVKLYPNPVENILYISSSDEIQGLSVLDQNGRIVREAEGTAIDVSTLSKGMYFLKVDNGQNIQVEKFLKL